jgi:acyl carrier protein
VHWPGGKVELGEITDLEDVNHAESVRVLVLETLSKACNTEQAITLQSDLGDIGFDSIALSALIVSAESQYRVEFQYEHVIDMFRSTLIDDLARSIAAAIVACREGRAACE